MILPVEKNVLSLEQREYVSAFIVGRLDSDVERVEPEISDSWKTAASKIKKEEIRFACVRYKEKSSYNSVLYEKTEMVWVKSRVAGNVNFIYHPSDRCANPAWALNWYPFPEIGIK